MPTDTADRDESIANDDTTRVEVEIELDTAEWETIRDYARKLRGIDDRSDTMAAWDAIHEHMVLIPIPVVDGERKQPTELLEE